MQVPGTWADVEETEPAYIEFVDVVRSYGSGSAKINALDGASFRVGKGELAVILGASGAGKTTAAQHPGRHGPRRPRARCSSTARDIAQA